jgi:5-methylcytosine-specific restriction endonuclease McrA
MIEEKLSENRAMSGGKSKKDPYYQKDPPKRTKSRREEPLPKTYRNAVTPFKIGVGPDGKKRYYYHCAHCGGVVESKKRKKHRRALHGKDCQYEWQKYGQERAILDDEQRKKRSEITKRLWKDPEYRKKTTDALGKALGDPEYRKKRSRIAKEVASRPEWKAKQSKLRKGKKRPPEVGRKISAAKMGHPVSKETRKKLAEANRGEKSYFWKGGVSGEKQKFYRSWQWRMQNERVKARDNSTCQGCGWTEAEVKNADGKLNGHHVIPLEDYNGDWHSYPDEKVTTLCEVCHGASEYQDGKEKWPLNGRGDDARLDRLTYPHNRQTSLDEFD